VFLVGIAGAYRDRLSVGTAYAFAQVGCYGVGFGSGEQFRTAFQMGWSQWQSVDSHSIHDSVDLCLPTGLPEHATQGLLLTVTSAAREPADCCHRLDCFPSAVAEDMEAFGVAVACQLSGVPLTVIRGISNQAGDRDKENWQIDAALRSAAELVSRLLAE
jgi:futalosine hydrolase